MKVVGIEELSAIEQINFAVKLIDENFTAKEITGEFPYRERKGRVFGLFYGSRTIAVYSSPRELKRAISRILQKE